MRNVFIISGPAGSGKDAVIEGLREKLAFERVVTSTTRPMRPGEHEGAPYYFLTRAEFEKKIGAGEFIEHSTNENAELYGVTKKELERFVHSSKITLWKLDWKGVISAKKLYPTVQAILITAPLPILEARLRKRDGATRTESYFTERMEYTHEWLKHIAIYDYIIENEEGKLAEAIEQVRAIIEGHLTK